MTWILFVVFIETSHEALATFDNSEDCRSKAIELEMAYAQAKTKNGSTLLPLPVLWSYECIPAPKNYKLDK